MMLNNYNLLIALLAVLYLFSLYIYFFPTPFSEGFYNEDTCSMAKIYSVR
jgi:hypothetical protein